MLQEQQAARKHAAALQRCELEMQRAQEYNDWLEAEGGWAISCLGVKGLGVQGSGFRFLYH